MGRIVLYKDILKEVEKSTSFFCAIYLTYCIVKLAGAAGRIVSGGG